MEIREYNHNTTTTIKKKKNKRLIFRANFQRHDHTAPQATKAHDFKSDARNGADAAVIAPPNNRRNVSTWKA
jgi:hypothetical protein